VVEERKGGGGEKQKGQADYLIKTSQDVLMR
jgi:hypothetical protein